MTYNKRVIKGYSYYRKICNFIYSNELLVSRCFFHSIFHLNFLFYFFNPIECIVFFSTNSGVSMNDFNLAAYIENINSKI